jgi:hypothetical protein
MPFASQAQRAKFYADPKLRKFIPEFEAATPKGKKLPQHVGDKSGQIHKAAVAHMKRRQ